jgi:hypothetical protein
MQCRRQDARHVLCDDGHSRHVVVHLSAGLHVSVDEHQPQPGESSWQPHTSVAAAHTSDEDTLNVRATSFACAAAASSSESACSLRCIDDQVLSVERASFLGHFFERDSASRSTVLSRDAIKQKRTKKTSEN